MAPITHGMSAAEVRDLGRYLQQRADRLRQTVREIDARIHRIPWSGNYALDFVHHQWPRHRADLLAAADRIGGLGQSALNNASEQLEASGAETGVRGSRPDLAVAASLLPPAWAAWDVQTRARHLLKGTWADGDALWGQLSRSERNAIVAHLRDHGELSLIPPEVRYAINRAAVFDEWTKLNRVGLSPVEQRRFDLYDRVLRDDLQVLTFDPGGDGRIAVVTGSLTHADNIAVQVPGVGNDMSTAWGLVDDGIQLHRASGSDTAVVTWLGYDTPDVSVLTGPEVATQYLAGGGAGALKNFVTDLDGHRPDASITVVGHSYGSVVTGLAAARGMPADRLVLIGSPGAGVADVGAFSFDGSRPEVFVGRTLTDPIARLGRLGTDPGSGSFGADLVTEWNHLDPSSAHSAYYRKDSPQLGWMGDIVAGRSIR